MRTGLLCPLALLFLLGQTTGNLEPLVPGPSSSSFFDSVFGSNFISGPSSNDSFTPSPGSESQGIIRAISENNNSSSNKQAKQNQQQQQNQSLC